MKGSMLSVIIISIGIIVVIGMLGYIILIPSNKQQISEITNMTVTPTIVIKDFAPNVPMSQKTTIIIQLSDSSREKYIVPINQVNTYVKSLPEGDHVVSKSP
ncbi:MAG TPA: hypothetical protein VNW29_07095 [Candidatus Sulfotelmatobacter sp.]|jgi:hypothetical protein|nr:hypothetical protein [Candidatus Sulfotelmatobacter sp.]